MKAITLWQPWASFVADGKKQYETRSFKIKHRGYLAIHAAKTEKGIDRMKPFAYPINIPFGVIVCVVVIKAVYPTELWRPNVSEREIGLGDWSTGRFAWALELKHKFKEPIPAIGRQGIWNINTAIYGEIMKSVKRSKGVNVG